MNYQDYLHGKNGEILYFPKVHVCHSRCINDSVEFDKDGAAPDPKRARSKNIPDRKLFSKFDHELTLMDIPSAKQTNKKVVGKKITMFICSKCKVIFSNNNINLFIHLFICLFIFWFVYLFIYLFVYLFIYFGLEICNYFLKSHLYRKEK